MKFILLFGGLGFWGLEIVWENFIIFFFGFFSKYKIFQGGQIKKLINYFYYINRPFCDI